MSLKPPRWVVALITNHGCLLPAAASAAAIPIIDGIYEDGPDQAHLKYLSLSSIAQIEIWLGGRKHFALSVLERIACTDEAI